MRTPALTFAKGRCLGLASRRGAADYAGHEAMAFRRARNGQRALSGQFEVVVPEATQLGMDRRIMVSARSEAERENDPGRHLRNFRPIPPRARQRGAGTARSIL
jgi:hypothetical protein